MKNFMDYVLKTALFGFPLLATVSSTSAVDLLDFIPDEQEAALMASGVDADQYLAEAIANGDGVVTLPRGKLLFDETVHLKRRVHLIGEGGGLAGNPVTHLVFAPNTTGIVVHRSNTGPSGSRVPLDRGRWLDYRGH
jgi:hypothetical protein